MNLRTIVFLVAIAVVSQTAAKPVRRTLNFNMFVLRPKPEGVDRIVLTTDGVSRFGPILEYFLQRVQGMLSVRVPPKDNVRAESPVKADSNEDIIPLGDVSENEVDSVPKSNAPAGLVLRPSSTNPGTFEVEIDVVVDDGQTTNSNNIAGGASTL